MQTRRRFMGALLAALGAGLEGRAATTGAGKLRTDGVKPLVEVTEGLGGGRVLCLSNRSQEQMFGWASGAIMS